MISKITGGPAELLFTAKILGKYEVGYFKCKETGFIQTEDPYWLEEAYSSVITKLDIGLVQRNQNFSEIVGRLIVKNFNKHEKFLDYAGGYGLFTRMMRDKGLNFYHTDKFCQNIFAENFDLDDLNPSETFEIVTAFEVFEHLVNPIDEISEIFKFSSSFIFSTELQPNQFLRNVNDWWYFAPEVGQHISFYNEKSLQFIADRLKCNYYTDGSFLHLFTYNKFTINPLKTNKEPFFVRKIRKKLKAWDAANYPFPQSLLQQDWQYVKDLIQK